MKTSFWKAAAAPQSAPHALPTEALVISRRSAVKNVTIDGVSREEKFLQSAVATVHNQLRPRPKILSTTSYTQCKVESDRPD